MALLVAPSFLTRIDSALFRVLLLRPFPLSFRCADVAVLWIPVATFVQRVRGPVCWDGADLRSRVQLPECAAKQAGE